MCSHVAQSLEGEIREVRKGVATERLNGHGLPALFHGHDLAAPSIVKDGLTKESLQCDRLFETAKTNSQLDSRLFTKLPGEVRTLIYREYIGSGVVKFCPVKGYQRGARGAELSSPLPLLLSCRRVYQEALGMLYSNPTWWLLDSTALHLPSYIHKAQLNAIRHVVVHYHTTFITGEQDPVQKLSWLGTWQALSQFEGLQTLDVTLYCGDTAHWGSYGQFESEWLKALAVVRRPRRFSVTVRWPEEGEGEVDVLPCQVRRKHEQSRIAEGYYAGLVKAVTAFPHRYCLLGWEEDSRRNPESVNECFPLRNQEGMRKGYLRTYRSMPAATFD